jgi:hypothetical protein
MQISSLKNQVAALKASIPPKPPRVERYYYSQRREDSPPDDATHFFYTTTAEREAIEARLHALPEDPDVVRLIVRGISREEIFREQYEGGPFEHLWLGTSGEVAS